MKYKQGGTIELGDWVKHKELDSIMQVTCLDSKCGLLKARHSTSDPYFGSNSYQVWVRPKHIVKAEPEDLI